MRYSLSVLFIACVQFLQAQQQPVLKNKRGILILPQRGDFCLGVSANPFLAYAGNLFNNSTSNGSPAFTFAAPNNMLFGKYMKDNNTAYRGTFTVRVINSSLFTNVPDLSPDAPLNALVTNTQKQRSNNIGLSFGIEKRRGNTRLQGFYGAEASIAYNSDKRTYAYGNKIEYYDTGFIRVTELKSSRFFSVGIRGFAGVEYFVAPNFSIGGELGYGPAFRFNGASSQVTEQHDFTNGTSREEVSEIGPKSRSFNLDTDNYNGVIKMLFYF